MRKILSYVRNKGFHFLDILTGKKIMNQYHEIKLIDENDSNSHLIKTFHERSLNDLVAHATRTTEFYKKINENIFENFPVINKKILKNKQKEFFSDVYKSKKLYKMSTSGSTGEPFTSYQNELKKRRVHAEVIYYSEKAGYKVGNKLLFLRAMSEKTKKSRLTQWLQNEELLDINKLGNTETKKIINKIKRNTSKTTLLGYASTLDIIARYSQENNITNIGKLSGIISSSEILTDDTRKNIANLFNCKVVSRYANQENGLIGQDEELNNNFIINEASYYVEIFDINEDKKVKDGVPGRIVITDLFNEAMPLIRYDTGDIGSKELIYTKGRYKYVINNFSGRKIDMISDVYGNTLSPHSVSNNMWKFTEVKQFQFIQKDFHSYTMKVVLKNKRNLDLELKKTIKSIVGEKAFINIEYVEDIPVLPSGKRKYIINEID